MSLSVSASFYCPKMNRVNKTSPCLYQHTARLPYRAPQWLLSCFCCVPFLFKWIASVHGSAWSRRIVGNCPPSTLITVSAHWAHKLWQAGSCEPNSSFSVLLFCPPLTSLQIFSWRLRPATPPARGQLGAFYTPYDDGHAFEAERQTVSRAEGVLNVVEL